MKIISFIKFKYCQSYRKVSFINSWYLKFSIFFLSDLTSFSLQWQRKAFNLMPRKKYLTGQQPDLLVRTVKLYQKLFQFFKLAMEMFCVQFAKPKEVPIAQTTCLGDFCVQFANQSPNRLKFFEALFWKIC